MVTSPTEQRIITALNRGVPDKIPNFVQSIMGKLTTTWIKKNPFKMINPKYKVKTTIGNFTVYKNFGYDSHWCGAPRAHLSADGVLKGYVKEQNKVLNKNKDTKSWLRMNNLGSIHGLNRVTNWYVESGIKTEKQLRFFLDHLTLKPPKESEINRWRTGREQCLKKDFVPFAAAHVVMEPGNQSLTFGLIAKLMRKNPDLINEFYDLLTRKSEMEFKAAAKAGFKTFCTPDDCAYKTGPMLSPKNYRKFVMPYSKRLCDIVRDNKGVVFMHTDGLIDSIMDCFIDAGYHAIQPLEPTSGMNIERVKKNWGNKLALIGNVDTTNTLSFGTPDDARKYVHRCFKEAKGTDAKISGYMFAASGSLHDKVKYENAMAMLDEYRKVRDDIVPI